MCKDALLVATAVAVLINSHRVDEIEDFPELARISCNEVVTRIVVGFCCAASITRPGITASVPTTESDV
jgi:hypothetical protein